MNVTIIMGIISMLFLFSILIGLIYFIRLTMKLIDNKEEQGHPINEAELFKIKEYIFFDKYANIPFTEYRTVTFSAAFGQLSGPVVPSQTQANLSSNTPPSADGDIPVNIPKKLIGEFNDTLSNGQECTPYEIDFDRLAGIDKAYESYVKGLLGVKGLGDICRCPDGSLCKWKVEMLAQFMYDTTKWDLKSIEIYKIEADGSVSDDPISRSLPPKYSGGNYAFVEMTNQKTLSSLAEGSEMLIVFKIFDEGIEKCIVLKNKIPSSVKESEEV